MFKVLKFQNDWLTRFANDQAEKKARDCNTEVKVVAVDSRRGTTGKCVRVSFMRVHLQAKHDDLLVWLPHMRCGCSIYAGCQTLKKF